MEPTIPSPNFRLPQDVPPQGNDNKQANMMQPERRSNISTFAQSFGRKKKAALTEQQI
jgi:hypothetical protein